MPPTLPAKAVQLSVQKMPVGLGNLPSNEVSVGPKSPAEIGGKNNLGGKNRLSALGGKNLPYFGHGAHFLISPTKTGEQEK